MSRTPTTIGTTPSLHTNNFMNRSRLNAATLYSTRSRWGSKRRIAWAVCGIFSSNFLVQVLKEPAINRKVLKKRPEARSVANWTCPRSSREHGAASGRCGRKTSCRCGLLSAGDFGARGLSQMIASAGALSGARKVQVKTQHSG